MIRAPQPAIGLSVDRGWMDLDDALLARYRAALSAALERPASQPTVPLGLLLSLRGEPFPTVDVEPDTVSVHGGHTLQSLAPLRVPGRYQVVGRLDDLFDKRGRSGHLTVIARSTRWLDPSGAAVALLRDQQIVRRIPSAATPVSSRTPSMRAGVSTRISSAPFASTPEPGDVIAVERRNAPDALAVRRYAEWITAPEPLFVDRRAAQRLGFADVIVPGPLQSALLEDLLVRALPEWSLQALSCTFRISLVAAEAIALRVIATEVASRADALTLAADLTIENTDGESAAIGDATLRRRLW
ncbi:MAG: hypothetical protein SF182_10785 [Deltaproteobacteria bacterium]|nr:hypothetical protein [Deltaproteobacteria bacterium]